MINKTVRSQVAPIEIRIKSNGNILVRGTLVTNSYSEPLFCTKRKGFYKETIKTGAFSRALEKKQEAPALLLNHRKDKSQKIINFGYVEDSKGLNFDFEIEPTIEFLEQMDSISGVSFGFTSKDIDSIWTNVTYDNSKSYDYEREILNFEDILEISMLTKSTLPAYSKSKIFVGDSLEELQKKESEEYLNEMKKEIQKLRMKEVEELKVMLTGLRK